MQCLEFSWFWCGYGSLLTVQSWESKRSYFLTILVDILTFWAPIKYGVWLSQRTICCTIQRGEGGGTNCTSKYYLFHSVWYLVSKNSLIFSNLLNRTLKINVTSPRKHIYYITSGGRREVGREKNGFSRKYTPLSL